MNTNTWRATLLVVVAAITLAGCSKEAGTEVAKPDPVHFHPEDECHVCGMSVMGFPGPKGEALGGSSGQIRKFCSTRDLFAWALQPENAHGKHTMYVHDMAQTEWKAPADAALIDAREAYYVVGSKRTGAMGPTLASFGNENSAHEFSQQYGGRVLSFGEVTLDNLNEGIMADDSGQHAH